MLVAVRQFGRLPVDVEVLDTEPGPEGRAFQDVVEFSLPVHASLALTGWDPFDAGGVLPVRPSTTYRVRYAIADADLADGVTEPPYPERYRLRLWPQSWAPPRRVRVESAIGRYWSVQPFATRAKAAVESRPPGTRTAAMLDIGIREQPDVARRIAAGEAAYRMVLAAYAQKIWPVEVDGPALMRLIDDRIRAALTL
jgi:hypothetical protein